MSDHFRLIIRLQYGSSLGDDRTPSATHDISRVNYHVKHLPDFARTLEDVRHPRVTCLARPATWPDLLLTFQPIVRRPRLSESWKFAALQEGVRSPTTLEMR